MEFLIADPEPEDEYLPPSYSDKGWIIFEVIHIYNEKDRPSWCSRYEIEVIDHDSDSSVLWLNEGIGIDYWLDGWLDIETCGIYRVDDIYGQYFRGDGWTTDDDEEWYCGNVTKLAEPGEHYRNDYCTLNPEQREALMELDRNPDSMITPEIRALLPGIHFCDDWDGLPVCIGSPEESGCTCGMHEFPGVTQK